MLLTITNRQSPADDLSFLAHKHPDRLQKFSSSFGCVHVFYPVANESICQLAILLDVDPIALVRSRKGNPSSSFALAQYVNDRPYALSSFLSVSLTRAFGSALSGRCTARPELVEKTLDLTTELSVLPCRGGEEVLRSLFEPLGYQIQSSRIPLDNAFPDWGMSKYYQVTLSKQCSLHELLNHLYVLVPVLDDEKHYWVGDDEVKKLLRRGKGWLETHPDKERIAHRYLRHQKRLTRLAMTELVDASTQESAEQSELDAEETEIEKPIRLNEQRYSAVLDQVEALSPASVIDFGCGEGKFLKLLTKVKSIDRIVGMDVSLRSLELASKRLRLDQLSERARKRLELLHGSLMYRDQRVAGADVGCAIEVIEHLDPSKLAAFTRVIFEFARPRRMIITTPNSEYNVKFENLVAGKFRHRDHRFEWSREEFERWSKQVGKDHGYGIKHEPIGDFDETVGAPTQMAIFDRES